MDPRGQLTVAIAQVAPVLLDRAATIAKVVARIDEAAARGAALVAFGETVIPAYPVWLARSGGARFEDPDQRRLHQRYLDAAVCLEDGDLGPVQDAARRGQITVVVGVAERPRDRGGHTLYCSCVVIDPGGAIASCHRKLMPTHEERLAWGIGDGHGLRTHALGPFTLGALNCWENWMPLARAALHAQGEDLHVALWPGSERLTRDITRFIAYESRAFVLSASGLLRDQDIPDDLPLRDQFTSPGEVLQDGGSCIAGPDGEWICAPTVGEEALIVATIDRARVRQARQSFDPSGHYARPDVLGLTVDRRRLAAARLIDE